MYADDTIIYTSGDNLDEVQANLQHDLDSISNWLAVNRLSLNVAKTKCTVFSTRYYRGRRELMLYVNNEGVEQVSTYKYLGIHLDEHLSFSDHIDFIVNNSRCKLGMLKRIRRYMNQDTSLMLYKTLVVPLFDYGDIIYMNTSVEQLDRIQKLQNVACRVILIAEGRTHIVDMHAQLSITTLEKRRLFHLAIFIYKIMKGLIVSLQLAHLFEPINLRHAITTRANARDDLVVPRTRTSFGCRAISVTGPITWNNMTEHVRGANTIDTFKTRYLKEYT